MAHPPPRQISSLASSPLRNHAKIVGHITWYGLTADCKKMNKRRTGLQPTQDAIIRQTHDALYRAIAISLPALDNMRLQLLCPSLYATFALMGSHTSGHVGDRHCFVHPSPSSAICLALMTVKPSNDLWLALGTLCWVAALLAQLLFWQRFSQPPRSSGRGAGRGATTHTPVLAP